MHGARNEFFAGAALAIDQTVLTVGATVRMVCFSFSMAALLPMMFSSELRVAASRLSAKVSRCRVRVSRALPTQVLVLQAGPGLYDIVKAPPSRPGRRLRNLPLLWIKMTEVSGEELRVIVLWHLYISDQEFGVAELSFFLGRFRRRSRCSTRWPSLRSEM